MTSRQTSRVLIDRPIMQRLANGIRTFVTSEVGGKAKWLAAALIGLMFAINGLNVVNSYVGRDFITAIEGKNLEAFIFKAGLYILVFAASTVAAVLFRYAEESLGILWREWLTKRLLERYLDRRNYYRIYATGEIANPDQRITDDVKAFTVTTLSFTLMFLNGSFTAIAFSGVLWSITPLLFVGAVLYAGIGSYVSYYLGRNLVGLNYSQFDKEADFRTELIHLREHAESIALLHREQRLKVGLLHRLDALASNFRTIIKVNRNLGYYTTWYNYLAQIVPALIVGPMFIADMVEFGVVTQSAMAFTHLLGAFSLIVTNFQSISAFTAVIARLGALEEAISQGECCPLPGVSATEAAAPADSPAKPLEVAEAEGRVAFENVSLFSPHDSRPLMHNLTVSVPAGTRLLISGANEDAKIALFRATAGIWSSGTGRIIRPPFGHIYFLPERPYLPRVTLRELLVRTGLEHDISDERIFADLKELELQGVLDRAEGLDIPHEWGDILSLVDQHMLAFARLFLASPRFAFMEKISHVLNPEEVEKILALLSKRNITYLTAGRHGKRDRDDRLENYDAVLELDVLLELQKDGGWHLGTIEKGSIVH